MSIVACDWIEGLRQGLEVEALLCEAGRGRLGQAGLLPNSEARGSAPQAGLGAPAFLVACG